MAFTRNRDSRIGALALTLFLPLTACAISPMPELVFEPLPSTGKLEPGRAGTLSGEPVDLDLHSFTLKTSDGKNWRIETGDWPGHINRADWSSTRSLIDEEIKDGDRDAVEVLGVVSSDGVMRGHIVRFADRSYGFMHNIDP